MKNLSGLILKCVGGLYFVETDEGIYKCAARGRFRREGISPCAGDMVRISGDEDFTGAVEEIFERKNHFARPPLANLDRLFVVASMMDPAPQTLVIDKVIAAAESQNIEPVLVLNKTDLADPKELLGVYRLSAIPAIAVCCLIGNGVDEVKELLFSGGISAFIGNSGVGKSSLLNSLFPSLGLKTGEISQKLGRGRHTTREVELISVAPGTYVADTPGFSTFSLERYKLTDQKTLESGFREFGPYIGNCVFSSCSHTTEKGCAVLKAVNEGKIARSRHESYVAMYNEIKDVRQWEQKTKNA